MATQATTHHPLGEATVAEFEHRLRGRLVRPGDPDYDDARTIWNGAHDARPALIVRCAGVGDVMLAVDLARSENLDLAVRGGGHSLPGFSTTDDGIVVDLSAMNAVRVDPVRRTAVTEGGATWADLDHETQAFGLATTGGLISSTGVAGLTLGGGIGWLVRKHGLAADNLIGADVVTADGRHVHCDEQENRELLWGLRGGGGNFGIVTSLEFRLHPVGPTILGGPIFFDGRRAAEIVDFYRSWAPTLPDDVSTLVNLTTAPPAPFLPEQAHGKPIVAVVVAHSGEHDAGQMALAPLKALADPIADLVGPIPYAALQSLLDPLYPRGVHNYFRAAYIDRLDDTAVTRLVAGHERVPSPMSEIHIQQLGGAMARGGEHAAFGDRSAQFVVNVIARTPGADGFDDNVRWARETVDDLEPVSRAGSFVNFMGDAADTRLRASYGDTNYERLVALKRRYDPANLFHLNQNVSPR